MKIPFQFEPIENERSPLLTGIAGRTKVYGGWLVTNYVLLSDRDHGSLTTVFIPDQNHEWEIECEKK